MIKDWTITPTKGKLQGVQVLSCMECLEKIYFDGNKNPALIREQLNYEGEWIQDENGKWSCPRCSNKAREILMLGQAMLKIPDEKFNED